jgi:hypothetical protein
MTTTLVEGPEDPDGVAGEPDDGASDDDETFDGGVFNGDEPILYEWDIEDPFEYFDDGEVDGLGREDDDAWSDAE